MFDSSPGVAVRRVLTATFTAFAVLGMLLGGIGLYGVVAHDVACRRAEIAIRMALGARPVRILVAMLAQGASIVGAGLIVGAALSLWATRALGGVLGPSDRIDAIAVVAPAIVMIAAGVSAVLPAARRAARTDPVAALRAE